MTLAIFLVGSVFGVFKDYVLNKISFSLNKSVKEESFRHILHLPLYHEGRLAKGDYIYRQNDVTTSLSDLTLNSVSVISESIILIIGVLIIMLKINAPLAVITLVMIPFLIVSVKKFGPMMSKFGRLLVTLQSKMSSLITESIDNTETVQAFTLQERQVDRLKDVWQKTYEVTKKAIIWSDIFNFSNGLVVIFGTSLVIYLGGSEALKHKFSLGDLLLFMTYMGYLISPIQSITEQVTVRRQKLVNVRRIYEVLTDHENIEYQQQDVRIGRSIGRIDFQNVTYAYNDKVILDQINMTIMPGEKIGIIGPSGAGKSTLLRLLDLYL
jgi:ABC-type multidrug transport system fused ATPase/permease subunit